VRMLTGTLIVWFLFGSLPSCGHPQEQTQQPQSAGGFQTDPEMEAANVLFRYSPELAIHIVRLRGKLVPSGGHSVATFNDPASFKIAIEAAELRMTTDQLEALMNARVASSPKAQVKDVRISVSGDQLLINGVMKNGLRVPFHAAAKVAITDDNRIRIDLHQVKVVGVQVKGLLDALGLSIEDLVSQKGLNGMSVDGDSFLIDPQTVFPPPQIEARLKDVRIAKDGIVLQFGAGAPQLMMGEHGNYIAIRGGKIEYGRDEMFDSDLTMIDTTPADPFEFYLGQYWRQMVAGSIKVTPNKALRIRVPDYSKIK